LEQEFEVTTVMPFKIPVFLGMMPHSLVSKVALKVEKASFSKT
jgi:hypothetical protein